MVRGRLHRTGACVIAALWFLGCADERVDAPVDPCAIAPSDAPDLAAAAGPAVDASLDAHFEAMKTPGVVVHVAVLGQGTVTRARGFAHAIEETTMPRGGRFRIGSVTKTFTGAAAMQLVEEGVWSLDEPIDDWAPGWDFGEEVTLQRLLNHTGGIYNYTDDPGFLGQVNEPATPAAVIDFALEHPAPHPPGTGYNYSNTGYMLLGLALEKADGRPYDAVLRDRLIDPLGLESLHMEQFEDGYCSPVQGHVGRGTSVTEGFSMTWAWAAGGLAGDTVDLCRWIAALEAGEVVSPASLEAMKTPSEHGTYGLGLDWASRGGREVYGHTGSTMGFNGELYLDPATGTCVAIQTNDFFGATEVLADPLWSALADSGY